MAKEIYIDRGIGFDSVAITSGRIEESLEVMRKNGIKNISINSVWGWRKGATLRFLKDNTWIEGVHIVDEGMDISLVNGLRNLKTLFLADKYKGELDFANFPELRQFSSAWNLKQMKNLESCGNCIEMRIWKFPYDDLNILSKLRKLEKLQLNYGKLRNLDGVENFRNLKQLDIYSQPGLTSLEKIDALSSSLEILMIDKCKKVGSYEPIGELKKIKRLLIDESAPAASVKFIRKLQHLDYCGLYIEILDKDPEPLKERGFEFKRSKNYK